MIGTAVVATVERVRSDAFGRGLNASGGGPFGRIYADANSPDRLSLLSEWVVEGSDTSIPLTVLKTAAGVLGSFEDTSTGRTTPASLPKKV